MPIIEDAVVLPIIVLSIYPLLISALGNVLCPTPLILPVTCPINVELVPSVPLSKILVPLVEKISPVKLPVTLPVTLPTRSVLNSSEVRILLAVISPAILRLPPTPTPPAITKAPVVVSSLSVLDKMLTFTLLFTSKSEGLILTVLKPLL